MDRIKNIFIVIRLSALSLLRALRWLSDPANITELDKFFTTATAFYVRYIQFYKDNAHVIAHTATSVVKAVDAAQVVATTLQGELRESRKAFEKNFGTTQRDLDQILKPSKKSKKGKKTVQEVYAARCSNAAKARTAKAAKRNRTPDPVSSISGVVEIPSDRQGQAPLYSPTDPETGFVGPFRVVEL